MRAALKNTSYWCFWAVISNVANVSSSAFKNSLRNLASDFESSEITERGEIEKSLVCN